MPAKHIGYANEMSAKHYEPYEQMPAKRIVNTSEGHWEYA